MCSLSIVTTAITVEAVMVSRCDVLRHHNRYVAPLCRGGGNHSRGFSGDKLRIARTSLYTPGVHQADAAAAGTRRGGGGGGDGVEIVAKIVSSIPQKLRAQSNSATLEKVVRHPEKVELMKSLESWAERNVLPYLKTVEKSWQPQDYLPEPSSEGFLDEVKELRARAVCLPDDYLVCLVGDMITEECLPTYQSFLNSLDGIADETGASCSPWARWTRAWTAEEKRHGDLLSKYLYLTGRVDMRQIQKTIQYLIGSGMDVGAENNPYLGFIYTSFQERATFIAHGNTARHAKNFGDGKLATVCGLIAADERRHENAYTKIMEKLFQVDPDGATLAFAKMMKKKILMPAHLMYDGQNEHLFSDFSLVAQRTGVYTAGDYAEILEHLVNKWNVANIRGISSEAQKAQEYLCSLPPRVRRLEERSQAKVKKSAKTGSFSWIFNREVALRGLRRCNPSSVGIASSL